MDNELLSAKIAAMEAKTLGPKEVETMSRRSRLPRLVLMAWRGLARVERFARRRVSLSQGNTIACDRPSPRSDRPLSGC